MTGLPSPACPSPANRVRNQFYSPRKILAAAGSYPTMLLTRYVPMSFLAEQRNLHVNGNGHLCTKGGDFQSACGMDSSSPSIIVDCHYFQFCVLSLRTTNERTKPHLQKDGRHYFLLKTWIYSRLKTSQVIRHGSSKKCCRHLSRFILVGTGHQQ